MNKNHEFGIVGLWLIAILATFLLVGPPGIFTYLAPLYFVCMLGCIIIVRSARRR